VSEPGAQRRRSSLILRWFLLYAALFSVLVAGVLALVSWTTLTRHESAADRELEEQAQRLHDQLVGRSETQMAAVITRTAAGGTTLVMLATERREYLAGNLRAWPTLGEVPAPSDRGERLQEFPLGGGPKVESATGATTGDPGQGADMAPRARGTALQLPGGYRLLVAREVTAARELRALVRGSLLATLAITVVLGIGGGVVLSRRLSSRLEALSRNSQAILAGDLHRRMPVSPRGDEFDAMAESLNRMLDRIEDLMAGMRAVSESIAHDLRSPISRLRSRIEVALMQPADAAATREVLEQTVRDIDHVLAMFNALLTIAVAESGAPRERFADVDLAAIAADAVETYEPAAEEAGLRLALDAPRPVRLRGEPHLLAQALANLLDNAVKYVPSPGRIVVRVAADQANARLEVADDGPGLPDAFRERAFERFTRVEASRTTPGSGLGLSLVRAVAHLHGGDVVLSDAAPGLVVRIELPT
jgi:signal transduction histidine kinase